MSISLAVVAMLQAIVSPPPIDISQVQADLATAKASAASAVSTAGAAQTAAGDAQTKATAAQVAANAAVKPGDLATYMPRAEATVSISQLQAGISTAQAKADAAVATVNGTAPVAGDVTIPAATFIAGFTNTAPGALVNLYANAPCNAARLGQLAVVTDLYGSLTDNMRCTKFGTWGYQWRATIPFYAASQTVTGGTVTISCNTTPPVLRLQGTLTSALSVVFDNSRCTPGQREELQTDLSLGLFGANANGLVGSAATKVLGATSSSLYIFDTTGWRPY